MRQIAIEHQAGVFNDFVQDQIKRQVGGQGSATVGRERSRQLRKRQAIF